MQKKLQDFLAELKRRRVVRVLLVYFAFVFGLLQLADIVLPALELSADTLRILVVASLVGLPVVVALAWTFDLTSHGIVRALPMQPGEERGTIRWVTRGSLLVAGGAVLITLAASLALGRWLVRGAADREEAAALAEPSSVAPGPTSIAVLPLANVAEDPSEEYFSDGLSDELRIVLSGVPGLRVAARSSTWAFKGRNADARTIGQELGVSTVLEGSVRKSGDRVRISVQLVDARNGLELWSSQYARTVDDIFAVQEEIALSVVAALETELETDAERPEVRVVTRNAMAHDKYLWGLFNLGRATEEGTQDAIGNFQSAIGLDSNFAAAYAGLADAELASLNHSRATDLATLVADAEASAQAAVRLDPELSAAHASLGQAKFYAFDISGAEAEFVRAIEADPDDPVIRQRYAAFLIAVGRVGDGLAHARVAVDRDPLSPAAWSQLLRVLRANGRYADAIGAGQEILRLNPNEASAWLDLGLLFLLETRPGDAADALERYAELGAVDPREFAAFAEAAARYAADGATGQVPTDVLEAAGSAPVQRAVLQQLVGETDGALSTLSQAHRQRHPNLTTLNTRPELAPLRETLPFLTILADLGLSP